MSKLINACKESIVGILRGFDRIIFQGKFRCLQYADGVQQFLSSRNILFKNANSWVQEQTKRITLDVEQIAVAETGRGITPLASSRQRKEDLARARQRELGLESGLIGAWSCVEECKSFRIRPAQGRPVMVPYDTRCKHLYLYFDDPTYGFMSLRLQTWFPFMIQIAMNGREWLGRSLSRASVDHKRHHNKIIHCADFAKAQFLLSQQAQRSNWQRILRGFVPTIFPGLDEVVGNRMAYSWYTWQSEWATDLIFKDVRAVHRHMEGVLEHALATDRSASVMRFFDKATNKNGLLRKNANPGILSRMLGFGDGLRLRHWLGGNSVKVYNQFNVVRVETTINDPGQFKIPRRTSNDAEVRAVPMRKGVVDMAIRAKVSNSVNDRMLDALEDRSGETVSDILAQIAKRKVVSGRRVRGLCPFDKDRDLLQAVARPEWMLKGFSNAQVREQLRTLSRFRAKTDKQLAGYVTRTIRLLRDHGLIRKYPRQHRYQLNTHGRQLANAVQATLAAEIPELLKKTA